MPTSGTREYDIALGAKRAETVRNSSLARRRPAPLADDVLWQSVVPSRFARQRRLLIANRPAVTVVGGGGSVAYNEFHASKTIDGGRPQPKHGARSMYRHVHEILAAASISLAMAIAALPAAAQFAGPRPPAGDGGGAASGRIERLEQQITDLRGVVAAVETLAKSNSGGGSGYAAAGGGANSEQVRQLSEQIADITQRIERLEARLGEGGGVGGGGVAPQAMPRPDSGYGASPAPGFEDKQPLAPLAAPAAPAYAPRQQQSAVAPHPAAPAPAAAAASGPARALFDQGYGALNRREYSAAKAISSSFSNNIRPIRSRAVHNIG